MGILLCGCPLDSLGERELVCSIENFVCAYIHTVHIPHIIYIHDPIQHWKSFLIHIPHIHDPIHLAVWRSVDGAAKLEFCYDITPIELVKHVNHEKVALYRYFLKEKVPKGSFPCI